MIEYFKKLEKYKWLPWLSLSPFLIAPILVIFGGEALKGIAFLSVFASTFVGIIVGGFLGKVLGRLISEDTLGFVEPLSKGMGAFGFLVLPVLVVTWTNALEITNIELYYSMGGKIAWAGVIGFLAFWYYAGNPNQ